MEVAFQLYSFHWSYISSFVALIAGVVLVQKAKYLHEVYFHDIESQICEVSENNVMITLPWRTTLSFAKA